VTEIMRARNEPYNGLFKRIPENVNLRAETVLRNSPSEFEIEEATIENAVKKRKNEYRTGRHIARQLLKDMGITPCAIPSGEKGEPVWPQGVAGSISHCPGLCVAAIALRAEIYSIGIDVEPNKSLPAGVAEMVFSDAEKIGVSDAPAPPYIDVLTFSAKESIFKCMFPLVGFYFDFQEVDLIFDHSLQVFAAKLPCRITERTHIHSISGTYCLDDNYIFSFAYVGGRSRSISQTTNSSID